ncbi:MAG: N-acetyltransferase family protein [Hyphomonadaceae bacterium]
MTAIVYRDGEAGDAAALAAFARATWTATFGDNYPPEDLRAFLDARFGAELQTRELSDPSHRYRLALKDGALAGYCLMGPLEMPPVDEPSALELHRLYLAESAKGTGIADALMEDCVAWARAGGASALYLSVWENNHRAQRFYRRHGFADHGVWDFMVGRVADRDFIWRRAL